MPDLKRPELSGLLSARQVVDLCLVCSDGSVTSHQSVWAGASSFLRRILTAKFVMEDGGKRKDNVTLLLPEFSVSVVDTMAQLLETGESVVVVSVQFRQELQQLWHSLKIETVTPESLSFISNPEEDVVPLKTSIMEHSTSTTLNESSANSDDFDDISVVQSENEVEVDDKSTIELLDIPDQNYLKSITTEFHILDNQKTILEFSSPRNSTKRKSAEEIPVKQPKLTKNHSSILQNNSDVDPEQLTKHKTVFENDLNALPNNVAEDVPIQTSMWEKARDNSFGTIKLLDLQNLTGRQNDVKSKIDNQIEAYTARNSTKRKSTETIPEKPSKETKTNPVMDPINPSLYKTGPVNDLDAIPCYVCNASHDKEKRLLNLKNIFYMKNHVSKCLYSSGRLCSVVPPGKDNTDTNGKPIDEFGLKNGYWYRCEVEGCWLQQKKGVHGQVCYKVFAIHMSSQHGVIDKVLQQDADPKARDLLIRMTEYAKRLKGIKIEGAKVQQQQQQYQKQQQKPAPLMSRNVGELELEEDVDDPEPPMNPFTATTVAKNRSDNSKNDNPDFEFKILGPRIGLHNCFLCQGIGRNNKDGSNLSFKDISTLKEHYARCMYNEKQIFRYVSPGPKNIDGNGAPIDELGESIKGKYKCPVKGCWLQKKTGERGKVGYKVYAIHMASQHGVLEQLMESDPRPVVQEILTGLKVFDKEGRHGIAKCRFESCKNIQFKADSKRELKLHYSSMHFRKYFNIESESGLPPGFTKTGTRAICESCSGAANKPVYIQGEKEAVMGHLVVKHDVLLDILKEAASTVPEARSVLEDVYPDQLTEVYMKTLGTEGQALPFSEDFMAKMSF